MRASHRWLTELSGVGASAEDAADRLTRGGLEVESIEKVGDDLDRVVVAEVRAVGKIEGKDKLSLVTLFDGTEEIRVVCGAPNVPAPPGRVLFARTGAALPNGMQIGEREIAGVVSRGMICSETELNIGNDERGIFVFDDDHDAPPGTSAADALSLRDAIFEIGLTPNRPDCLGHVGLARELASLSGHGLSTPSIPAPAHVAKLAAVVASEGPPLDLRTLWRGASETVDVEAHRREALGELQVRVSIADPQRCPRYGAAVVLGVKVAPSPFWLRYRLHRLGVRAIHNVVDVTNFVLYEWGHPIHAFDLANVRGRRIDVRLARRGETMATLDDVERTFTEDDLLICDGDGPVAVAGVMGGANSEIGPQTTSVLIECAYFDPRSVRRTGRRLSLHTDASHRFERGVDPGAVPAVLARTAQLVANLCGGAVVPEAIDAHPAPVAPARIRVRNARTDALLGYCTPPRDAERIYDRLGCHVERLDDGFVVTAPSWRPDLCREVDLIEEVARVQGFDRIPVEIPPVRPSAEGTPRSVRFDRRLRRAAAAAGLCEAISYSFVSPDELRAARVPTDAVPLLNPLSEERSVMRTSLLPGLAAAARHAQRRQVARVALFEVAHVFAPSTDELPLEESRLSLLLLGPRGAWIGEGEPFDFFDGKGCVDAVVRGALGVGCETKLDDDLDATAPFLHPRRRARVEVAGACVGLVGELHPDVVDALELNGRPIFAELSVSALLAVSASLGAPQARALPRFPSVSRDIAMLVGEQHSAAAVATRLRDAGGDRVEEVTLFDLYRGEQIPAGQKSLAFRVVYRDSEGTLTDAEVDRIHGKVAKAAENAFGAAIR